MGLTRMVVNGAFLRCSSGTDMSKLVVTSNTVEVSGHTPATAADHVAGTNIFPFGPCKLDGKPCEPAIVGPWSRAAGSTTVTLPVLPQSSLLFCKKGACIGVIWAGQRSLLVMDDETSAPGLSDALAGALKNRREALEMLAELAGRFTTQYWKDSTWAYACGIASSAMALSELGIGDMSPAEWFDYLMEQNTLPTHEQGMDDTAVQELLARYGATATDVDKEDWETAGYPLLLNTRTEYTAWGPPQYDYIEPQDENPGLHWVVIYEDLGNGLYLIGDPLIEGPVVVTKEELQQAIDGYASLQHVEATP